ncbi:MAG: hypothetical protein GF329_04370 [Candidatus Lokiarchaeota archaeon]|nr:hypothetical protein [Candidatus Lokiarchaeota archaeon]
MNKGIGFDSTSIELNDNIENYSMILNYTYNWIDATKGLDYSLTGWAGFPEKYSLPFNFTFYNETFDYIFVSPDGFASFINQSNPNNAHFPSKKNPYMIAPYWDDLVFPSFFDLLLSRNHSSGIYVRNLTSPDRFVIQWKDMYKFGIFSMGSFEIILLETGEIIFNYKYVNNYDSYTCGLNFGFNESLYNEYQDFDSNITNYSICFVPHLNKYVPELWGGVSKTFGDQKTLFTFTALYKDLDNSTPTKMNVIVDGLSYHMHKRDSLDNNYRDGCIYEYQKIFEPGVYNFYFECSDGRYFRILDIIPNITVKYNPFYEMNQNSSDFNNNYSMLIYPRNNASITAGKITLIWDSLNLSVGPVNYTLQVSNTSDFRSILFEEPSIVENTPKTNYSLQMLSSGIFYWRVRPWYDGFKYNWSEYNSFRISDTKNPIEGDIFVPILFLMLLSVVLISTSLIVYIKASRVKYFIKLDEKNKRSKSLIGVENSLKHKADNIDKMISDEEILTSKNKISYDYRKSQDNLSNTVESIEDSAFNESIYSKKNKLKIQKSEIQSIPFERRRKYFISPPEFYINCIKLLNEKKYGEALETFNEIIEIFRREHYYYWMANCYEWKAYIYILRGNQENALKNYHEVINLFKDLGNINGIIVISLKIGSIYYSLGDISHALSYGDHAKNLAEYGSIIEYLIASLMLLGKCYYELYEFKSALRNYFYAFNILKETNNLKKTCECLIKIGETLFQMELFENALKKLKQCLYLIPKNASNDLLLLKIKNLEIITKIYRKMNKNDEINKIRIKIDKIFDDFS